MNVTITVSDAGIYDTITTAFEQGIYYWGTVIRTGEIDVDHLPQWLHDTGGVDDAGLIRHPTYAAPVLGSYTMIRDRDGEKLYEFGAKQIQRGLQILADEGYKCLGNVLRGEADAREADVFVQLCLLGKVVYG